MQEQILTPKEINAALLQSGYSDCDVKKVIFRKQGKKKGQEIYRVIFKEDSQKGTLFLEKGKSGWLAEF